MKLSFKEACLKGPRGPVHEAQSYFKDFGFALSDIRQPVHYWWGTEDKSIIRLHAEAIEEGVKNAVMHYKNGEGHLSIYIHCFEEVLQGIVSAR